MCGVIGFPSLFASSTRRLKENHKKAKFQIILISLGTLVGGMEWRSMPATDVYQNWLTVFGSWHQAVVNLHHKY